MEWLDLLSFIEHEISLFLDSILVITLWWSSTSFMGYNSVF